MKRTYDIPQLAVSHIAMATILTVSTESDWKDTNWDDALKEEGIDVTDDAQTNS